MAYVYPENKFEIIDGNTLPIPALPTDVVLVIERAFSGPSDQVYVVQDMLTAQHLYGERSPLINLANRARSAGAKNIALYRIGGHPHEYINIFGEGSSITLTEQSVDAAKDLKVYIGPEPKNTARQCIIIYKGDRIIYSNVVGAEVNSYAVQITGFDKKNNTFNVGTPTAPVDFTKLLTNGGAQGAATAAAKQETVASENMIVVSVADISGFNTAKSDFSSIVAKKESGEVVPFQVSEDKQHLVFNPYVDGTSERVKPSDNISFTFIIKEEQSAQKARGAVYTPAKDSIAATWKELYEELDKALRTVEMVDAKAVLVGDWANIPNIAHGSKDPNSLEYLMISETDGGDTVYEWSKHKTIYRKQGTSDEETADPSEAETNAVGMPLIVKQYGEVDFVHRLGMMAFRKLQDGFFLNIVTGVQGPSNNSVRAIDDWIGTSPKYDLQGRIVENGTGLLGHRLMVGDVSYRGGYFATHNGFVDGDVLSDSTGFSIDLGKHISVVVSQVVTSHMSTTVTSGAAAYASLVSLLEPGDSTTNAVVRNHALMTTIKEHKRRELAAAGYVVFLERPRGLTVYSGDVATRDNSDFDFISTSVTLAQVTKLITQITDPFLGRGTDMVLIVAMKAQLESALANAQREGWFTSYVFDIQRDGPNSLKIPFAIQPKEELRRIYSTVRLTSNDFTLNV